MRFSKRKWGWYFTLLSGVGFKVKLLYFGAGKSLSMQRHMKRSEIWLFLRGDGKMWVSKESTVNKHKLFYAGKGASMIIRALDWHQYTAKTPTFVLEIQTGQCEEEDIERKE